MTQKPKRKEIENAFIPAREITDAERFAGREEAVSTSYYALLSDGAHIAIVGNRGVGKSSLARQIVNMSEGETSLLDRVGLEHDDKMGFLTVYYACGRSVSNIEELLESLLTAEDCFLKHIYDVPRASEIIVKYKPGFKAKFGVLDIDMAGEKEAKKQASPAISSHPIYNVFTNIMATIVAAKPEIDGVLVVIDEFDQIADRSGFASFMKSLATNVPKVKFCLVGVAQDLVDLMKEHESSDRLFAGGIVSLPPMSFDELAEIIGMAEAKINRYIVFGEDAKKQLINVSQGHPYLVHLFGKYSLRAAFERRDPVVTAADVSGALGHIAENKIDPILENRYRSAVGASAQREIVLKELAVAKSHADEVFTGDAYKGAIDRGVDNPSQYVGQLVSDEYGAEIIKVRDRYYRFKDSLFHAYVVAHPLIRQGEVDQAACEA